MIEKTLRTTKGKILVKIPTALNEITLGQMIAMQDAPYLDDLQAISILSGIPKPELYTVKNIADFDAFGNTIAALSQQIKNLYNSEIIPDTIVFTLGKRKIKVKVMRNLSIEPAGAFMAARDIIAAEINDSIKRHGEESWKDNFRPSLKACCHILAHYFFCRTTGKTYNEYEAEEFTTEIEKLRVTEALPIAKHFFTCYPSLSKPKIGCLQRLLQRWKIKRASGHLKNSSTSTP